MVLQLDVPNVFNIINLWMQKGARRYCIAKFGFKFDKTNMMSKNFIASWLVDYDILMSVFKNRDNHCVNDITSM